MTQSSTLNKEGKNPTQVITICYILSISLGIARNFNSQFPSVIGNIIIVFSLLFGLIGLVFFFINYGPSISTNTLLFKWLFLCCYMGIVGFVNIILSNRKFDLGQFLAMDITYIMYWTMGFSLVPLNQINFYKKLMKGLGLLAILFGVIALVVYPYDLSGVSGRIGIWSMPYYLWWLSGAIFVYNYASARIASANKIIGYGSFFTYLILGLLFLKRAAFLNCLMLFLFCELIRPKKRYYSKRKVNLFFVVLILVVLLVMFENRKIATTDVYNYFDSVFMSLSNRFQQDSFDTYDRATEAMIVLKNSTNMEKIFGYGLGNYPVINGHLYSTLHTGAYNYIFKGGIVYLAFWLYLFTHFLLAFCRRKYLTIYDLVCLSVLFSAILSSFYEFGFTSTILPIGYATPIAYLVDKVKKAEVN